MQMALPECVVCHADYLPAGAVPAYLLVLGREEGNIVCTDYIGITFPFPHEESVSSAVYAHETLGELWYVKDIQHHLSSPDRWDL